ncbi:MAG: ribose 5-phosphate isomerase B [Lachnospiraceae bacterium]|nr:ribose 5-phosphate isomerase B [Lachnospiraceae bacterium]
MKIAIANDHAAVDFKNEVVAYLKSLSIDVVNMGTDENKSVDYPDFAYSACKKVVDKEVDLGILICGTGVGMSIAANKVKGIRAVVCSEPYSAMMSRQHNDANVLCLGARVVGIELAKVIIKAFLDSSFLGDRHQRRVDKINKLDEDRKL